ncbi:hypothetical protein NDU88_009907 [Pleurodeles waltl]|uniref:Uncharacterized protein n=1 Tax=Pleurodeles waltl TaxID=8319 RepID=A0AAV7QSW8_PLEWA|nr:hypothetical protein NDU88_009907 [Pleurodeles waltl]
MMDFGPNAIPCFNRERAIEVRFPSKLYVIFNTASEVIIFQDFFLIREEGRGTWRPVEALTANSHRTRDADERRDLRPLTWKRRAESRSSPAVGSTRERITAAVEGPPCCDEEEVWRRDAGEETRGETGIVQGS